MFKKIVLFVSIGFSLLSCSSSPGVYTAEESAKLLANNTDIKIVIDNIAHDQLTTHNAKGVVIGVVTPEGESFYSYGFKDVEKAEPMTPDTLFQIGSVTKIFTSSLLLRLDQKKILSVKDPIKNLFPETFHPVSKQLGNLTFESLSSHSSGLPSEHQSLAMMGNAMSFLWTGTNIWKDFDEKMMWDFFGEYDFGELKKRKYHYSNTAYIFLGNLIGSAVPGSDYETLLEKEILSPMHLRDTKFDLTPEQKLRVASGYSGDAPIFMSAGKYMEPWEIRKGLRSSGSLYSTAPDLIKFLKMNMGISKETVQMNFDSAHERRIKTPEGHVGLGWFIETLTKSRREVIYANGIISGYTSFIGFDNNSKVGIVVLENTMNMRNDIGKQLLDRIVYNYNQGLDFKLKGISSVTE